MLAFLTVVGAAAWVDGIRSIGVKEMGTPLDPAVVGELVVDFSESGALVWANLGELRSRAVSGEPPSGLAIRKPPKDCDRLRSPFIARTDSNFGEWREATT